RASRPKSQSAKLRRKTRPQGSSSKVSCGARAGGAEWPWTGTGGHGGDGESDMRPNQRRTSRRLSRIIASLRARPARVSSCRVPERMLMKGANRVLLLVFCAALGVGCASAQSKALRVPLEQDASGTYGFLEEGEFVQLDIQDAKVGGFVSRFGHSDADK